MKIGPGAARARATVEQIFQADVRSLAALRIVLAITVLIDLAIRATNLAVHYSNAGILPRAVQVNAVDPWQFSLHVINDTVLFQAALFGSTALAALGMLVGYRTRLMTVIVWALVLSLQWRNFFVGSSADDLLHLLLFWAIFLPLGAVWSVDRWRGLEPEPPSMRVVSMGTAALFLQIAFMYWFTAVLKSGPEWRVDGTALYYALSARQIGTPIGASLLQFPELLKVLTFGTLALEVIAPLVLFSPVFTVPARLAGILAIVGLHLGIALTLSIGIFPLIGITCMVAFLPGWFWDSALPRLRAALPDLAVTTHPAWQTLAGLGAGRPAWSRLASFGAPGHLALAGVPAHAASSVPAYQGRGSGIGAPAVRARSQRRADSPLRGSLVANALAAIFLVYVFCWNLAGVSAFSMPASTRPLGVFLGLTQYWTMFAPYPTKGTTWHIVPGTLRDGRQIDLLPATIHDDPHRFAPIEWGEPRNIRDTFGGEERWRKYLESLSNGNSDARLLAFGQYVCREWNGANGGTPSQLMTFDIIEMWQATLEENQRGPVVQDVLWSHVC